MRLRHAVLVFGALPIIAASLPAQVISTTGSMPTVRTGTARRLTQHVVVDGRLDDAAWRDAELFTGFTQREPQAGAQATERTEVRMFTDDQALYVGAWLYDSRAAEIIPGEKVRDGQLTNSDYFAFILDTFHDRQNGFVFATTPAGIEYDGQVTREGEEIGRAHV